MKVTVIPIIIEALGTILGRLGNQRTSEDHPDYSIIKIDQNSEKSPRDEDICCHFNFSEKPSANPSVKIS